jgi:CheY-like chemotaxis protein
VDKETPIIFVLDDDRFILKAIERVLNPIGHIQVATAWGDLATALTKIGRDPHARVLLVCDLEMPGIRGIDFCRLVRKHTPAVKIVIFSGSAGELPPDVVDAVVPKASGLDTLVRTVQALLRRDP